MYMCFLIFVCKGYFWFIFFFLIKKGESGNDRIYFVNEDDVINNLI